MIWQARGLQVSGHTGRCVSAVILAVAVPILASCGGSSPTEPTAMSAAEVEFQLLQLANGVRQSAGVADLSLDENLSEVARSHSRDMRDSGYFSHASLSGLRLADRLRMAGIDFRRAAENLAKVSNAADPAGFAHNQLMDSAVHRRNIVDGDFELAGVGVAKSGDTYWVTQVFVEH
jgi:uncharacterized protein YkwD